MIYNKLRLLEKIIQNLFFFKFRKKHKLLINYSYGLIQRIYLNAKKLFQRLKTFLESN